jgi:hypothetical protein
MTARKVRHCCCCGKVADNTLCADCSLAVERFVALRRYEWLRRRSLESNRR